MSGTGCATTSVEPQRSQCGAAGRSQLGEHPLRNSYNGVVARTIEMLVGVAVWTTDVE